MSSFNLIVLGDGSVGKSSIIEAFRNEGFMPIYKQTVGCDFYEKHLKLRGDEYVSLRVWDIGGQSIHSKNLEQYISSSNAIFLVYDVTNIESFRNLEDWLVMVRKYSSARHIYLVGNKVDLIAIRQVDKAAHDKFVEENGFKGGLFMSAKTGENVVKTFYKVAGEAIGVSLSAYELAFHDKVISANVAATGDGESRTTFADEIEAEDRKAEEQKMKMKQQPNNILCQCSIS